MPAEKWTDEIAGMTNLAIGLIWDAKDEFVKLLGGFFFFFAFCSQNFMKWNNLLEYIYKYTEKYKIVFQVVSLAEYDILPFLFHS